MAQVVRGESGEQRLDRLRVPERGNVLAAPAVRAADVIGAVAEDELVAAFAEAEATQLLDPERGDGDRAQLVRLLPILYGHRSDDPTMNVAATLDIREDDHRLLVHGKFDNTPTAKQVYALVKGRRLNQLSFAYDTLASAPVKLPDGTSANELRALKLYEISLVPVGANQDTSVLAVKSAAADRAATNSLALRLRILSAVD